MLGSTPLGDTTSHMQVPKTTPLNFTDIKESIKGTIEIFLKQHTQNQNIQPTESENIISSRLENTNHNVSTLSHIADSTYKEFEKG